MAQQVRVQGLQQSERFKTADKIVRPGNRPFHGAVIRTPRTDRPKQDQADHKRFLQCRPHLWLLGFGRGAKDPGDLGPCSLASNSRNEMLGIPDRLQFGQGQTNLFQILEPA
jgi:hypothetical protein